MLALIVVVCIAAITTLGSNANCTFSSSARRSSRRRPRPAAAADQRILKSIHVNPRRPRGVSYLTSSATSTIRRSSMSGFTTVDHRICRNNPSVSICTVGQWCGKIGSDGGGTMPTRLLTSRHARPDHGNRIADLHPSRCSFLNPESRPLADRFSTCHWENWINASNSQEVSFSS